MRATAIAAHEKSFFDTRTDSGGKKYVLGPFEATVPGTNEKVPMVLCTRANGDASFYYRAEHPKERIVLHFTMGYLKGDLQTLTKPNYHVAVPFVVARDGTILNLWPSKFWSFHLGENAAGGNEKMSRSSVGIEISNIGPLTPSAQGLRTDYGDVYCTEAEPEFYTALDSPFREKTHFATFTDAQYGSIIGLLRFLTAKYQIPRVFLEEPQRYGILGDPASFRGITTHVNYRKDKMDFGPAFDWGRVVAGVRGTG